MATYIEKLYAKKKLLESMKNTAISTLPTTAQKRIEAHLEEVKRNITKYELRQEGKEREKIEANQTILNSVIEG